MPRPPLPWSRVRGLKCSDTSEYNGRVHENENVFKIFSHEKQPSGMKEKKAGVPFIE